jgi:hypothetical protein
MKPRGIAAKSAIRIGRKPVAEGGALTNIKLHRPEERRGLGSMATRRGPVIAGSRMGHSASGVVEGPE